MHARSDGKASYTGEGRIKHRWLNNFFQKRQEHKLTFDRGGRSAQVDWDKKWSLEVAEMNMLRGSLGVTWMIGSGMSPSEEQRMIWSKKKNEGMARLRWFGHVHRRDSDCISKMMLEGD